MSQKDCLQGLMKTTVIETVCKPLYTDYSWFFIYRLFPELGIETAEFLIEIICRNQCRYYF